MTLNKENENLKWQLQPFITSAGETGISFVEPKWDEMIKMKFNYDAKFYWTGWSWAGNSNIGINWNINHTRRTST